MPLNSFLRNHLGKGLRMMGERGALSESDLKRKKATMPRMMGEMGMVSDMDKKRMSRASRKFKSSPNIGMY